MRNFSISEYLAIDNGRADRSEYYRGEILAMAGAKPQHNQLVMNLGEDLNRHFSDTPCWVMASDTKVYNPEFELFAYPDLVVLCDAPAYFDPITLLNPTAVIEVLNPATENYDRMVKLPAYLTMPSVQAAVLVATETRRVEVYTRAGITAFTTGAFEFLGCVLQLDRIYRKVLG